MMKLIFTEEDKRMKPGIKSKCLVALGVATVGYVALADVLADKEEDAKQKQEETQTEAGKKSPAAKKEGKESKGVKKGKTRAMKTSTVMKTVVRPHCGALREVLKGELKTDKEWEAVISEAEILSEASYILMSDGRCRDEVWSGAATQTLRYCAQVIISAAEEKNSVVVRTAFGKLTESCTVCHDAHREKSPLMELVE